MSLARLKKGARNAFTVIGVVTTGVTTVFLIRSRANSRDGSKLPDKFVLSLDFEDIDLVEKATPPWQKFSSIGGGKSQIELRKDRTGQDRTGQDRTGQDRTGQDRTGQDRAAIPWLVDALNTASADDRVKGVFTAFGPNQSFGGLAQVQEVRQSILDFKKQKGSDVATIAYADSFGEGGSQGTVPYYMASASDKVIVQPMGLLSATGVGMLTPFVRRFFDLWDIKATFFKREGYKNAANTFTHETYSEEHRLAGSRILASWMSQIVGDISQSRRLSPEQVKEAVDTAPLSTTKAVKLGLLDEEKYRDQALGTFTHASQSGDKALVVVPITKYIQVHDKLKKSKKNDIKEIRKMLKPAEGEQNADSLSQKSPDAGDESATPAIAVLTLVGGIESGAGGGGFKQGPTILPKDVREDMEKIRNNPAIKAVVVRVDSPGGSAVGSETIYRQILRLKEAGKPVIVSMGNVAGSGGYYIAAPANKIVASPATITGSIGVFWGKFNVDAPARKHGLNMEAITEGKNVLVQSIFSDYTEDQARAANETIDDIYLGFMERVAKGRGKSLEEVRKIAGGRIWSGEDALKIGLVDELGGVRDAVRLAKQEAGLPFEDEDAVELVEYPQVKPPLAMLLEQFRGGKAKMSSQFFLGVGIADILSSVTSLLSGATGPEAGLLSQAAQEVSMMEQAGPQLVVPELIHSKFV